MIKLSLTFLFISLIILLGCTEKKSEVKLKDSIKVSDIKKSRIEDSEIDRSSLTLRPEINNYVKKLDSIFDITPYYTILNNQYVFYVGKGKWKKSIDNKFINDEILFGVISDKMDTLLQPIYSKIYNPDATVFSYIEIEINKKRGLYNYKSKKLIEPEFDIIFPSNNPEIIAFGKLNNEYYSITQNGKEKFSGNFPTYSSLGMKWNFDIKSKNIKYLHDCYTEYLNDYNEGEAIVFTPSYLFSLGFLPEIIENIETTYDTDFGITKANGKILNSVSITDNITALISNFYEEGINARGWQIDENSIITVDSKNNVLDNKIILSNNENKFYYCNENNSGFNYLDSNIIEVFQVKNTSNEISYYDNMTQYSYFKIKKNGLIDKLESNRFFDNTKFIQLNESHFKGCFMKYTDDIITIDNNQGNAYLYDHLTLEDLDLMRNEIYADYGFIFKTPKWKIYFSKQAWYKPKYDNIDNMLSEIDKKNIQLILSTKEKIKNNESKITNKRLIMYVVPG